MNSEEYTKKLEWFARGIRYAQQEAGIKICVDDVLLMVPCGSNYPKKIAGVRTVCGTQSADYQLLYFKPEYEKVSREFFNYTLIEQVDHF